MKHLKKTKFLEDLKSGANNAADLQYLKLQLLAQALVHHKFVMDLPDGIWIDDKTGKTAASRHGRESV